MSFNVPRLMIAAPQGRSGKTVTTLGLLRALTRRGLKVAPFKKGPDYIDPGWHRRSCGVRSRNLDPYFMDPSQIRGVLQEQSADADVCVVEAAMGLFDGLDERGSTSSAEVAKILELPVFLVIDVTRMTRTCAALVLGCMHFDTKVRIAGVILNRVRGPRQRSLITRVIEERCAVPVVGAIPVDDCLFIPDRHLGLITAEEFEKEEAALDAMAEAIEAHLDINSMLDIARSAPCLDDGMTFPGDSLSATSACPASHPRICVIYDDAFSFYYEENLQALQRAGAELCFANALKDFSLPPEIDALYIGGGFPEVFADRLEANESFRSSVRESIEGGLPAFAECGGLMYLGRTLCFEGHSFRMAGVFDFDSELLAAQQGHGYAREEICEDGSWLPRGTVLTGHEHHHSRLVNVGSQSVFLSKALRGRACVCGKGALCYRNAIAGYLHVNAFASPDWAGFFVNAARRFYLSKR